MGGLSAQEAEFLSPLPEVLTLHRFANLSWVTKPSSFVPGILLSAEWVLHLSAGADYDHKNVGPLVVCGGGILLSLVGALAVSM